MHTFVCGGAPDGCLNVLEHVVGVSIGYFHVNMFALV